MAKDDAKDQPVKKEKAAYEGQDTAVVSLPRARDIRGTAYGPGEKIRVPKSVADLIAAEDAQANKAAKQGKGGKK